jgi:hypothetical protein
MLSSETGTVISLSQRRLFLNSGHFQSQKLAGSACPIRPGLVGQAGLEVRRCQARCFTVTLLFKYLNGIEAGERDLEILVIEVGDWQTTISVYPILILQTSLKWLSCGDDRQSGSTFFVIDVGTESLDLIGSSERFSASMRPKSFVAPEKASKDETALKSIQ